MRWNPSPGRPEKVADVFISYKSERRSAVAHLARVLENYGFSVWFDWALLSGDNFIRLIEREIRSARVVVVLWCARSVQSDYVLEEAHLARKLGKIIPIRIEPVDLPLGFQLLDTFDLTAWDGSPKSSVIGELIAHIGEKTKREPRSQRRSLDELEANWRQYGALSLTEFPPDANSFEFERRSARGRWLVPLLYGNRRRNVVVCLALLLCIGGLVWGAVSEISSWSASRVTAQPIANVIPGTKQPAETEVPPQSPIDKYMVVISSFSDEASAQASAVKDNEKFRASQSDLHAVVLAPGSTPYWGVFVGTWVTLADARALVKKAKDQGFLDAYLRKAPS
jgi:TIR domain/SPOR domain